MLKRSLILVALAIMAAPAMAQTSFYTDRALQQVNVLTSPTPLTAAIPYGSVRVCGLPLTQASPCLPLASITDVNGNAISNAIGGSFGQITTDATGRFTFGCTLGNNYQVQVSSSAASNTPAVNYPITCPGVGANPQFASLSATNVTVIKLDGATYCDGITNATLNAAVAAVSTPGVVVVPLGAVCPVTANLTIPSNVTLQVYSPSLINVANAVTLTINGPVQAPYDAQVFSYTGTGTVAGLHGPVSALWFPGSDFGVQTNNAHSAVLPGAVILYVPQASGSCYNFATTIAITKFIRFMSLGATVTGSGNGTQSGNCLNFTVTASQTPAISIDVPLSGQTQGAVYGLENVHLINNGCLTTGGCASNAFGISCGNTNLGCTGAHFDNVAINGFLRAFDNRNANSSNYTWTNPQFVANQTIARLGNNTGNIFVGGTMAGNGSGFVADAAGSAFSLDLFGVQFFGNGGVTFDCTNVVGVSPCVLNGYDLHLEASPGGTPHFAQGNFDLNLHGGVAEDDVGAGSTDWMFNCSGGAIIIDGMVFAGGGRSITNLALLNSPCRASIRGEIKSSYVGKVTGGFCGGANAVFCSTQLLNGGSANQPNVYSWEAPPGASGSLAALTGTGACATFPTQTGGNWSGRATCTAATAASTFIITPGPTAANGWICDAFDQTTRANLLQQTSTTTAACTLTATSITQNDVIVFRATAF